MYKFKLFCIFFVLFLSLTGCSAGSGQLGSRDFHPENHQPSEQASIISFYSAIYEAIENRELEKAITLLQEALKDDKGGFDLMRVDDQGRRLLHLTIDSADSSQETLYLDLEIVRLLIKLKQNVNARNKEANTPLHIAAKKGLFLVAEELVKNGANIYAENEQGETPLHCAAEAGNIEVVRLLIDQHKMVKKIMKPLVLTGSDNYIDKKDYYGRTPLYLAMQKFGLCISNPSFGNPENYTFVVNFLLASGADVHTEDKYGTTLLHLAASNGCVEVVRELLRKKVEPNPRDEDGNSPLDLAIPYRVESPKEKDYMIIVNMLIEAGANVHYKDEYNNTLLHRAASNGNPELVKLLIAHKVEINSKDDKGYTPFHHAVINSNGKEFESSEEQRYLEVLDLLIQAGTIIDVKDTDDSTPLQLAISSGAVNVVILLINRGANTESTDSYLLLHEAIDFCYLERKDAYIAIIKYLISLGIGINNVDDKSNTSLHRAAKKLYIPGFQEVINLLIAAGADKCAVNNKGNTPLFYMKKHISKVFL